MSLKTIESARTAVLVTAKDTLPPVDRVPVVWVKMNPAGVLMVTPVVILEPWETVLRLRRTLFKVAVLLTRIPPTI
jgi:hypothetical protein